MGDVLNDFMKDFRTNMKIVPLTEIVDEVEKPINTNANQYRTQMLGKITQFSNTDAADYDKILKRFIRLLDVKNPAELENTSNAKVEKVFEQLANTTIEGKTEYESL